VISAAAIFIAAFTYIYFLPVATQTVVAQLVDQINAEWDETMQIPFDDGHMLQDTYRLTAGYVNFRFYGGVKLTIEAPAEWSLLDTNHMHLTHGRIYAVVPEQAHGFSVTAGNTKIIDLGTEFGVEVDSWNNTQLHVTKGETLLFYGSEKGAKSQVNVNQGAARQVDNTGKCRTIQLESEHFARKIDSNTGFIWKGQTTASLADIVGGGDGLGNGKTGVSVDITDGRYYDSSVNEEWGEVILPDTNKYIKFIESPYIDGVFMPDGGDGSVQISSENHIFRQCPDTSGNSVWYLSCDTAVGWQNDEEPYLIEDWPIKLNDKLYDKEENPAISMPPNKGITFDIEAMRKAMPGLDIHKFTSVCGIVSLDDEDSEGLADFWVLVDGQIRFKATDITRNTSSPKIDIKLNSNDRFLTLIVTDRKDYTGQGNFTVFAEPTLHLVKKTDAMR
jgi:hypothetical protein